MKQKLLFVISFSLLFSSLFALGKNDIQHQYPDDLRLQVSYSSQIEAPKASDLSDKQLYHIGIKMWQNQCGIWNLPTDKSGITPEMKGQTTAWEDDPGDNSYALIGALQFIWYPQEGSHDFFNDWPVVAKALQAKGYPIEDWMMGPCPWKSREEFMAPENFETKKMRLFRKMLTKKQLVIEQTRLVAQRAEEALSKILQAIDEDATVADKDKALRKQVVAERYRVVAVTNFYVIMDYVHFKGEGVLKTERNDRCPNGWGLRQVLETMDQSIVDSKGSLEAFIEAAIAIYPDQDDCDYKTRYETYSTFFYNEQENSTEKIN